MYPQIKICRSNGTYLLPNRRLVTSHTVHILLKGPLLVYLLVFLVEMCMYMYLSNKREGGGDGKRKLFFPEGSNGDVKKNRAFKIWASKNMGTRSSKPRVFDYTPTSNSPCLPA